MTASRACAVIACRGPASPGGPAADLVLVQAGEAFARLEGFLHRGGGLADPGRYTWDAIMKRPRRGLGLHLPGSLVLVALLDAATWMISARAAREWPRGSAAMQDR